MVNSFGKKDMETMRQYFISKLAGWINDFGNDTETILNQGSGMICHSVEMLLLLDLCLKFADSDIGEIAQYKNLHYPYSQPLFHSSDNNSDN